MVERGSVARRTPELKAHLRHLAHRFRHMPDRLLRSFRRREAIRRLRESGRSSAGSILVVCHGNICRSPYAAACLASIVEGWASPPRVRSAGFIGPGRRSPAIARRAAADRGIDLDRHLSRLITGEMLAEARLVVVMAPSQARVLRRSHGVPDRRLLILGDLDPLPASTREIRDPFDQPREVFDEVFGRIDRCLRIAADLLA